LSKYRSKILSYFLLLKFIILFHSHSLCKSFNLCFLLCSHTFWHIFPVFFSFFLGGIFLISTHTFYFHFFSIFIFPFFIYIYIYIFQFLSSLLFWFEQHARSDMHEGKETDNISNFSLHSIFKIMFNIMLIKSSTRNQNPSRYYNSLTNLKFQHKPKYYYFSKMLI
jgi:hypothetical protein